MRTIPFRRRRQPVDLALCIAAGATVLGLSFLSCWLLAVAHWPWAPRRLVDVFAPNPIETVEAMLTGSVYAILAGGVLGAAIGGVYNLIERVLRRSKKLDRPQT
jgi:hypothetical protein